LLYGYIVTSELRSNDSTIQRFNAAEPFVILIMSVLVVGSIAIDTVKTPVEEHSELLGGSASYAALAASFFSPVRLVGVVGDDFPNSEFDFWKSRKIDTQGVQRVTGKTFRWSGEYSWDLNTRETRSIHLNVFENFKPVLPKPYRETDFALLANIAPSLQAHVLDQMERTRFVVADTMDLWIETARADLDALLRRVDLLILNDSEAREMTKETSLIKAGRRIQKMGPSHVAIKKGEHGALLFGQEDQFFSCGAYPLEDIHDPTGAGDTFAGGMAGYLAGTVKKVHFNDLRKAMIYGSVVASFCVEAFSLERLRSLSMEEIAKRYETFQLMSQFETPPE
jgi:cytidine kinase